MSKKIGVVLGVVVIAVGLALLIRYRWSQPADEINRARFNGLLQEHQIISATVSPTPYPGIYSVEGAWKADGKAGKFSITTHLEESQVQAILDGAEAKIDVPGRAGILDLGFTIFNLRFTRFVAQSRDQ